MEEPEMKQDLDENFDKNLNLILKPTTSHNLSVIEENVQGAHSPYLRAIDKQDEVSDQELKQED